MARGNKLGQLPFRQPHIALAFQPCSLPRFAHFALAAGEVTEVTPLAGASLWLATADQAHAGRRIEAKTSD
jgi:hypothetical protein